MSRPLPGGGICRRNRSSDLLQDPAMVIGVLLRARSGSAMAAGVHASRHSRVVGSCNAGGGRG